LNRQLLRRRERGFHPLFLLGQTVTRIAPTIYIASDISDATQHWVGAMGSKNILAMNTDPEANMVTRDLPGL